MEPDAGLRMVTILRAVLLVIDVRFRGYENHFRNFHNFRHCSRKRSGFDIFIQEYIECHFLRFSVSRRFHVKQVAAFCICVEYRTVTAGKLVVSGRPAEPEYEF